MVSYAPGGRSLRDVDARTTRAIVYSMPGGEVKIISVTLKFVLSTQAAKFLICRISSVAITAVPVYFPFGFVRK